MPLAILDNFRLLPSKITPSNATYDTPPLTMASVISLAISSP